MTCKLCPTCEEMICGGLCACNRVVKTDPQTTEEIATRAAEARVKFADPGRLPPRAEPYDRRTAAEKLAAAAEADVEAEMTRRKALFEPSAQPLREESPTFGWRCPVHDIKLEVHRMRTFASSRRRHYFCPVTNCTSAAHTTENFDCFPDGSGGEDAD